MTEKIKFSIIIPLKEINSYVCECVENILSMNYENYEVIILPNEIKTLPNLLKNKKTEIIATGKVSPAVKRDIGARKSRGDYLAFIDDDAYPEKNWLIIAEKKLGERKIAAICGPAITPKGDSLRQKASGLFFETFFGGGVTSYRYKSARKEFYVNDYPSVNLIISKRAFFDAGGFNTDFWPGEDTKLCWDLTKKGYKILYSPELIVYHHRRKSFFSHLKQVSNYGKHRGYFAKKFPETSLKFIFFIPSLFLIGNIILAIASIFSIYASKIWLILLGIYFVTVIIGSLFRTLNPVLIAFNLFYTFFSYIGYGAGFLLGIFSNKFKSKLR